MIDSSHPFVIESPYKPTGDQPQAIEKLVQGLKDNKQWQVLQGATGTGKTFTMANIIQACQRTTMVLVHNKTLAAQLYGEFKELFPNIESNISYQTLIFINRKLIFQKRIPISINPLS